MSVHVVKSWPKQFAAVVEGRKTNELRVNDRDYKVGDELELHEYDPETSVYSGRTARVSITHILDRNNVCAVSKAALNDDYAILSVRLLDEGQ